MVIFQLCHVIVYELVPINLYLPRIALLECATPITRFIQADEAGTEPDPERDEILAAQVGGLVVHVVVPFFFFKGDHGEDLFFLAGNLEEGCYYSSCIYIYICFFQNVIVDS